MMLSVIMLDVIILGVAGPARGAGSTNLVAVVADEVFWMEGVAKSGDDLKCFSFFRIFTHLATLQ
jgi:hypothetical protein